VVHLWTTKIDVGFLYAILCLLNPNHVRIQKKLALIIHESYSKMLAAKYRSGINRVIAHRPKSKKCFTIQYEP
jgi:hypothetical protein